MKAIKTAVATVAALAAVAFGAAGAANSASLEPPGWTAGIALGGPLPEGAYLIDTATVGGWRGVDDHASSLGINVPVIAWSTPWSIAGGRIEFLGTVPEVAGGVPKIGTFSWSGRDYTDLYNPAAFVGAAWNLGGGWGFSAFIGGWGPADNELRLFGFDTSALSERVNLSYVADGWKLAANLSFGQTGGSQSSTVLNTVLKYPGSNVLPDWFNYDLTATKTVGKWEFGLVGFGSTDTTKAGWNSYIANGLYKTAYGEQAQFALGGLVGYSFPGISLQLYATRDVFSQNYYNISDGSKSYESRVWTRAVVPLWNPPALESLK